MESKFNLLIMHANLILEGNKVMHSFSSRLYTGYIFNKSLYCIKSPLFSARILHSITRNVSVPGKKSTILDGLYFQGFFVVEGTVLFVICIKEVPAFPIIKTIFVL